MILRRTPSDSLIVSTPIPQKLTPGEALVKIDTRGLFQNWYYFFKASFKKA